MHMSGKRKRVTGGSKKGKGGADEVAELEQRIVEITPDRGVRFSRVGG